MNLSGKIKKERMNCFPGGFPGGFPDGFPDGFLDGFLTLG